MTSQCALVCISFTAEKLRLFLYVSESLPSFFISCLFVPFFYWVFGIFFSLIVKSGLDTREISFVCDICCKYFVQVCSFSFDFDFVYSAFFMQIFKIFQVVKFLFYLWLFWGIEWKSESFLGLATIVLTLKNSFMFYNISFP